MLLNEVLSFVIQLFLWVHTLFVGSSFTQDIFLLPAVKNPCNKQLHAYIYWLLTSSDYFL